MKALVDLSLILLGRSDNGKDAAATDPNDALVVGRDERTAVVGERVGGEGLVTNETEVMR